AWHRPRRARAGPAGDGARRGARARPGGAGGSTGQKMTKRDWRYYRARSRARTRHGERSQPRSASEAVERLLRERLGKRGFPASLEAEAGRLADAVEEDPKPRRDLTA